MLIRRQRYDVMRLGGVPVMCKTSVYVNWVFLFLNQLIQQQQWLLGCNLKQIGAMPIPKGYIDQYRREYRDKQASGRSPSIPLCACAFSIATTFPSSQVMGPESQKSMYLYHSYLTPLCMNAKLLLSKETPIYHGHWRCP
jgi:hypothetical protein